MGRDDARYTSADDPNHQADHPGATLEAYVGDWPMGVWLGSSSDEDAFEACVAAELAHVFRDDELMNTFPMGVSGAIRIYPVEDK